MYREGEWQFYESALNDHENEFRNIMKTHETKCTKTHGKSLQNAWTKSTKAHRFKNRRQTNPLLKTIVQFDYLADCRCLQTRCVCVGLLCIASIRYLAGLYGKFENYFHV